MNNDWMSCDGSGSLSRRALLKSAALGGALSMLSPAWAQAVMRSDKQNENVLVVVFLRGGADALHMTIPYADDHYNRARPNLRVTKNNLEDLDGYFGFHAGLKSLVPAFKDGRLAVVHAIGSGDTSHSHFEAMATMEAGQGHPEEGISGGWLARHLAASPESLNPLRAISWGGILAESLKGASSAVTLRSLEDLKLTPPSAQWLSAMETLYAKNGDLVSQSGSKMLEVATMLKDLDPQKAAASNGATYPETPTGTALREAAFLIRKKVGLQFACLDSGGWDSHVAQGYLEGQMRDLADGIAAFEKDLGPEMSRVTVVVMSEFGRRLEENSGLGTDHGAGGAMYVLGAGVKGGKIYGDWPGLAPGQITGPGDLRITTDYRIVLAELLEKRFGGTTVGQVFPGLNQSRVGILA